MCRSAELTFVRHVSHLSICWMRRFFRANCVPFWILVCCGCKLYNAKYDTTQVNDVLGFLLFFVFLLRRQYASNRIKKLETRFDAKCVDLPNAYPFDMRPVCRSPLNDFCSSRVPLWMPLRCVCKLCNVPQRHDTAQVHEVLFFHVLATAPGRDVSIRRKK